MARGGSRPGAGRPAGLPMVSRRVREIAAVIKAGKDRGEVTHATALEFAMSVINDPAEPIEAKIRLAVAAMPFQHAKLEPRPIGKKEEAAAAAETAGQGSEWGDDLTAPASAVN
jgi:hypothetical protein